MSGHTKLHDLGDTESHSATSLAGLNALITDGKIDVKFRGWDRLNPDSMGDISYDLATRTFSITQKSGQADFNFYADGKHYSKTTTQSVQWTDATNTYYFYFDINGDLQFAVNDTIPIEMFIRIAICGLVYYNKEEGIMLYAEDEQHGIPPFGLVPIDHVKQHLTVGFIHASGGVMEGVVNLGSTYTKVTESLHFDEDIPISTPDTTDIPWIYRDGSVGGWVLSDADSNLAFMNSSTGVAQYNEEVNGVWQLTDSDSDTDFLICYKIKTNLNQKYMKVAPQQVFPTRGEARAALFPTMRRLIMEGMAGQEIEFQYAWIVKKNGKIIADDDGELLIDLRGKN